MAGIIITTPAAKRLFLFIFYQLLYFKKVMWGGHSPMPPHLAIMNWYMKMKKYPIQANKLWLLKDYPFWITNSTWDVGQATEWECNWTCITESHQIPRVTHYTSRPTNQVAYWFGNTICLCLFWIVIYPLKL